MGSVTSTMIPVAASGLGASLITDVVVAALVAGIVSLVTVLMEHERARRDRLREHYADAFRAYASYREFPYVVRRRTDDGGAERVRISEAFREVQEQLTFWQAWMGLESAHVAREYRKLIDATRDIAGNAIRRAWELSPVMQDEDMNISDYAADLKQLVPMEAAYVEAARRRLSGWLPKRG